MTEFSCDLVRRRWRIGPGSRRQGVFPGGGVRSARRRHIRLASAAWTVFVLVGCALPLAAQETETTWEPGTHSRTLSVNRVRRTYELHVPPAYNGKDPLPLVVVLHDVGGSGKTAERAYGMSEKADREGFVVAYPDAVGPSRAWNVGLEAATSSADDGAFLRTLIQRLVQMPGIDRGKLFVAGHGRGGTMAYRLAAEFSSHIAAIGVVGGSIGVKARVGRPITPRRPARPVSVIAFHGQRDDVVPYGGGYFLSPKESIAFWVSANGCATTVPQEATHGGAALRERFTDCTEEAEVILYTIVDGKHEWPGAGDPRPAAARPPQAISATDLMWEFFRRHGR